MAQQQQEQPRKDPRARRRGKVVDGTVINQNPDRHYVLAHPGSERFGLTRHLEMGYVKVNGKTEKERVVCGRVEDNGDVTYMGHVLVWCPQEDYEADQADAKAIIEARSGKAKGPGGIDNVVGVNGKPAHDIEN